MFHTTSRSKLIALLLLTSLSSCINITERIEFNKKGKGVMQLEIKLSYLNMLGISLDSVEREDLLDPLISELSNTPDISEVASHFDEQTYSYVLTFEFKHIPSLNQALTHMYLNSGAPVYEFFVWEDEKITRRYPKDFTRHFLAKWNAYTNESLDDVYKESVRIEHAYTFQNSVALIYSPVKADIQGEKNREGHVYVPLSHAFDQPESEFIFVFE